MKIFDDITAFCTRVETNIKQKSRKKKIILYSSGLKSKIEQSFFALENLHNLSSKNDHTMGSTRSSALDYYNQVAFYCDSFCIFLYSSLDVLSQIVNQVLNIGMDERKVDFIRIKQYLNKNMSGSRIEELFNKISTSRAFKNLNKYRNCSLHRRQIYIQEKLELVRHTEGYTVSITQDNIATVVRKICDDPYEIKPKVNKNRLLPDYLENIQNNLLCNIENIITEIR